MLFSDPVSIWEADVLYCKKYLEMHCSNSSESMTQGHRQKGEYKQIIFKVLYVLGSQLTYAKQYTNSLHDSLSLKSVLCRNTAVFFQVSPGLTSRSVNLLLKASQHILNVFSLFLLIVGQGLISLL